MVEDILPSHVRRRTSGNRFCGGGGLLLDCPRVFLLLRRESRRPAKYRQLKLAIEIVIILRTCWKFWFEYETLIAILLTNLVVTEELSHCWID